MTLRGESSERSNKQAKLEQGVNAAEGERESGTNKQGKIAQGENGSR